MGRPPGQEAERGRPVSWRGALRLVGALLVIILGVLAALRMHLGAALGTLRGARPLALAAAALLNFPIILLQALRWRLFLSQERRLPASRLFRYLLSSHTLNSWLPARAGDFVRIVLPATRDGLRTVTVVSTLLLERLFDALGIISIATPLFFLPGVPDYVRVGLLALLELALLGLAVVGWLARKKRREGPLADLRRAVLSVRHFRGLAGVALITLVYWCLELLLVEVSFASVGLGGRLVPAVLALVAVNVGSLVQLTPGNFVTFEAAVVAALAICGASGPRAVAAAIVYHLVQVLPVTLAGVEGLRLIGAARRRSAAPRRSIAPPADDEDDPSAPVELSLVGDRASAPVS